MPSKRVTPPEKMQRRSRYVRANRNRPVRRCNYCHSCKRDFEKMPQMDRHNRLVHKKQIHVCNECGSAYIPAELELHTRDVHREVQPGDIKCNVCATVTNPGESDQTCRVCKKVLIGNAAEGAGVGDGHGEGQGQGQGQGEDDGDEEGEDEDAAEEGEGAWM